MIYLWGVSGKLSNVLGYEGTIKTRHIKLGDKVHKACRICFSSEEMCKDLIKLGAVINKSLILKYPTKSQVPTHLLRHFDRGYVDGDGHICLTSKFKEGIAYHFSLLGTYELLDSMVERLYKDKIINRRYDMIKKDKRRIDVNNFYIAFNGENARRTIVHLYDNSNIYLDRKYEVAEGLIAKEVVKFGE